MPNALTLDDMSPRLRKVVGRESPRVTATEEPDGGNLLVRIWRGAGVGNLPAYSTTAFSTDHRAHPVLGSARTPQAPPPAAPAADQHWMQQASRRLAPLGREPEDGEAAWLGLRCRGGAARGGGTAGSPWRHSLPTAAPVPWR